MPCESPPNRAVWCLCLCLVQQPLVEVIPPPPPAVEERKGEGGRGQSAQLVLLSDSGWCQSTARHSRRSPTAAVSAPRFRLSIGCGSWHQHIEDPHGPRSAVQSAHTLSATAHCPAALQERKQRCSLAFTRGLRGIHSCCPSLLLPGSGPSPALPAFAQLFTVAIPPAPAPWGSSLGWGGGGQKVMYKSGPKHQCFPIAKSGSRGGGGSA